MRGIGKRPLDIEVRAKTDKEYALAALRNSIVRRVENTGDQIVVKAIGMSVSLVTFQVGVMIQPIVSRRRFNFRIGELQSNIFKITGKRFPGKTPHILYQEGFWP